MNTVNMKKAIKLIWSMGKSWIFISVFSNILLGIIPVLILITTKELVNSLANNIGHSNYNFVVPITLLILQLLISLASTLITNINDYIDKKFQLRLNYYLESEILKRASSIPLEYFDDNNFYDHLSRLDGSGNAFLAPFKSVIQIFRTIITLISMLGFLFSIHWSLVVFSLVVCVPMFIINSKFGDKRFWLLYNNTPEAREADYISQLIKVREASKEIRSFNLRDFLLHKWSTKFLKNNKANLLLAKKEHQSKIALDGASALFYGGAAFIIIWLIKKTKIQIGEFVVVGEAVHTTQSSINSIAVDLAQIYEKSLYINDYYKFVNYKTEDELSDRQEETQLLPNKLKKGIKLQNVSFKYLNSKKEILKNISLDIKPGEKIAIVGRNGSGKTTLVKCLSGLYEPTSGSILYDDIDAKSINPNEIRKKFSIIFQDFMRYYFKASENIAISSTDEINNKEKILATSKLADSHEFITKLDNGYNTLLGNFLGSGVDLSGGQWQKIAISRALFKEAEVLILDEPSSALDPITELNIYNKFNELSKDKTTIFISHRMASAKLADRILVLKDGMIIEEGTHEDLIKLDTLYAEMYNSQAKWYQEQHEKEIQEVLV